MPLPTPRKGETQQNFISRFMGNDVAQREFSGQKQRLAVAYDKWRSKGKKKKRHREVVKRSRRRKARKV